MYRPTVRYDEVFRDYVNDLFHATHLDRNQIMRGALFAAAHSKEFQALLKPFQKNGVALPSAPWHLSEYGYWMEKSPNLQLGGRDVFKEEPKIITFGDVEIKIG